MVKVRLKTRKMELSQRYMINPDEYGNLKNKKTHLVLPCDLFLC